MKKIIFIISALAILGTIENCFADDIYAPQSIDLILSVNQYKISSQTGGSITLATSGTVIDSSFCSDESTTMTFFSATVKNYAQPTQQDIVTYIAPNGIGDYCKIDLPLSNIQPQLLPDTTNKNWQQDDKIEGGVCVAQLCPFIAN